MLTRRAFHLSKKVQRVKPFAKSISTSSRRFDTWLPWSRDDNSTGKPAMPGMSGFPDFIDKWNSDMFYKVLGGLSLGSGVAIADAIISGTPSSVGMGLTAFTLLYGYRGYKDLHQNHHAIRKNFPFLGNFRYIFEVLRPELYQYVVESDTDGKPYDRLHRSVAYQRAKQALETLPFGTRCDVYAPKFEWINHSMNPSEVNQEATRFLIGGSHCTQPYSASILNISAMSYGSLSPNAILALNQGAHMGGFYHNTGEGGISPQHLEGGGDVVWNVGTAYFGARDPEGNFCEETFAKNARREQIKMIELKLSQGAKPGHGGILPKAKITPTIAKIRGIPMDRDCNSPPSHTAFDASDPVALLRFIDKLRELSGGKPIGIKFCLGKPEEFVQLVAAMVRESDLCGPDFITVDGGEGGTGAAPPEFSNHIGTPMLDAIAICHNTLVGAGIRDRVAIIASGKILTGFSMVRAIALGADTCNAARAFMFSLGCIQALKCNTNKCPSGVATMDPRLMSGLDPTIKSVRVANYHKKTIHSACEIIAAAGYSSPQQLSPHDIIRRVSQTEVLSYAQIYPRVKPGSLLDDNGLVDVRDVDENDDGRITMAEFHRWERKRAHSSSMLHLQEPNVHSL